MDIVAPDEDQGTDDRCDEAAGGEVGEVALGIAAVVFELDISGGGGGGGGCHRPWLLAGKYLAEYRDSLK